MSKKIMSVMLAIFMLASLCVVGFTSASAANTGYIVPTLTGEGEKGAKAGDEIHLILKLTNLDGRYGVNGEINTYFDDTKLQFVKPSTPTEVKAIAPAIGSYVPNFNLDGKFKDKNGYMGVHINFSDINGYDYTTSDGVVVNYTFKALTDIENLNDVVYMDIVALGVFNESGLPMITNNYNYKNVATADMFANYGSVSTNGGTWDSDATTEGTTETEETTETADATEATTDATEETTDATEATTDATETTETTDATEATTADATTSTTATTAPATTEKPEAPKTGEASTAVALMVVAIMAAGVVIFARKKATK